MKQLKIKDLNLISLAFFLLITPFAGAYAACCTDHGGVASCNKETGYKMCKDGIASPTCTCPKAKTTKTETTKGCCSGHGGVSGCNKVKGLMTCKDKTLSTSCTCH